MPGDVSLAHNGGLFLDESPEFCRHVLKVLRQPLENGVVTISRMLGGMLIPHPTLLRPCIPSLESKPKPDQRFHLYSTEAPDKPTISFQSCYRFHYATKYKMKLHRSDPYGGFQLDLLQFYGKARA